MACLAKNSEGIKTFKLKPTTYFEDVENGAKDLKDINSSFPNFCMNLIQQILVRDKHYFE